MDTFKRSLMCYIWYLKDTMLLWFEHGKFESQDFKLKSSK